MKRWFQNHLTKRGRTSRQTAPTDTDVFEGRRATNVSVLELLILTGADAGQRFTISGQETVLGRRLDGDELRGGILLRDSTVSSRQATIRNEAGAYTLAHHEHATNPTLVNGAPIRAATLRAGDRIEFGRVAIEVKADEGTTSADLTDFHTPVLPLEHARATEGGFRTQVIEAATRELQLDDLSEAPLPAAEVGWLEVVEDRNGAATQSRFALGADRTVLGRGAEADVRLDDLGVSRHHAELVWEGAHLVLYHKSGTNLTLVNREEVPRRRIVEHGDTIALAGRIHLRLDIHPNFRRRAGPETGQGQPAGLRAAMEDKVALERRIAEEFSVEGSFLDLDVVNSTGMKRGVEEPERIVLSFERFRVYVAEVIEQHAGRVLNSNGDELMCFFAEAPSAVAAAHAIFERLDAFNETQNLLDIPFAFRIGIHSGRSLVDLKRGVAYSATLDVAGHLQKLAPTNRITISEQTKAALPAETKLEWAGTLEREGFDYYLLEAGERGAEPAR